MSSDEAIEIWSLYRGRADCENRIKELKYDFGLDSFVMRDFWATEAALSVVMLAYNLMSVFRQAVIRQKAHQTLSTLNHKVLAMVAYWGADNEGDQKSTLNLTVVRKRRPWLESDDEARKYFYSKYYSSFFFEAQIFHNIDVAFYVLTHKYRQEEDVEFGEILSRMRIGQTTAVDINRINQCVESIDHSSLKNEATWLTNTNDRVDEINENKLDSLAGSSRTFHARISG